MSYYMKYALDCVSSPSIKSVPVYVKCLLDTCIDKVVIENGDMDKELFAALLDELRLYYTGNTKYKYIITPAEDGSDNWSNPYYCHIPGEDNSVLAFFTTEEGSLEISKTSIDTVIELMDENDILVNELLDDTNGLHGVQSYMDRLNGMSENIKYMNEAVRMINEG